MVVPGSATVKRQAEEEGLDRVLESAGFEWRRAGCSMCLGMNPDILAPGERCASTSNRNFEGRQGRGGRTHLVSPAMAAAAAIAGHFVDVREWERRHDRVMAPPGGGAGEPEGSPERTRRCAASASTRRGYAGETGFPPRDRAEGEGGGGVRAFHSVTARAAVLDRPDVDTDQIIPKQFLKRIERTGYGEFLFYDWRQDPAFELNRPECESAKILLTGSNFGCGSSREHAAWALQDFGFEVVVAPSFGDIFFSNAVQIGLVPVTLPGPELKRLMRSAERGDELTVDLESETIAHPGHDPVLVRDGPLRPPQPPQRPRRDRAHASARDRDRGLRGTRRVTVRDDEPLTRALIARRRGRSRTRAAASSGRACRRAPRARRARAGGP